MLIYQLTVHFLCLSYIPTLRKPNPISHAVKPSVGSYCINNAVAVAAATGRSYEFGRSTYAVVIMELNGLQCPI